MSRPEGFEKREQKLCKLIVTGSGTYLSLGAMMQALICVQISQPIHLPASGAACDRV